MSLDVELWEDVTEHKIAADFLDEHGFDKVAKFLRERPPERLFEYNVTHNLNRMAEAAGIYQHIWRPEELGIKNAGQLAPSLRDGLLKLQADPCHFKKFNPSNGWGNYDGFVAFVDYYLQACERWPDAIIEVSR